MTLERWGWSGPIPPGLGRIIREHKGGYSVLDGTLTERLCVVNGKLRRAIKLEQSPRPVPGDWVIIDKRGLILEVLPRKTWLRRRSPSAGEQWMGANIDTLIVVMSINQDFNVRRLERYFAIAKDGGVDPVVLLTKADLAADGEEKRALIKDAPVVLSSHVSGQGLADAAALLKPGKTHVLLGSSGVGKSTFVNRWLQNDTQPTQQVRDDGKGRHTTTDRQLFMLPTGAMVMDTPGMRELGVTDTAEEAFDDIEELAAQCRFFDCGHNTEPGCAVQDALDAGTLDSARFAHYEKLRLERFGIQSGRHERQRKR